MTSDLESQLRQIVDDSPWVAPQLRPLREALDGLDATMKKLAGNPGWEGAAARAAGEQWVLLQRAFSKVADSVVTVEAVIERANTVRYHARSDLNNLTVGHVPPWVRVAAQDADAAATVFIPVLGKSVPATSAVNLFESFLGNERRQAVAKINAALETELSACAAELKSVDFSTDFWDVPEPQTTPPPGPVPDPTIRVGGGGGYALPSSPTYDVPDYPGGGSSTPGGGSPAPGIGGSFPSPPAHPSPSIDDGSVGTLPGYTGGAGGGFGAGGTGGVGGYGGGANSGLTAGVLGGATAASAAALRFGTGGGFGGGGIGGGGVAGGVSGSGGLLGAGGAGQGGAGGAAGAGAGSGATGTGAAGGARGGMMGGQPMGGGAGAGKKDKRSGLGGLMAPKIEDDASEFIPLPDGARAGGRDQR